MIDIQIDTIDIQRFERKMRSYPRQIGAQFQKLIARLTLLSEREIKDAVRSGPTRAFDTGNLFNLIGNKIGNLEGEVISRAPYSVYVTSGTKYMRSRPYMKQGLENAENGFTREINVFLARVFKFKI